MKNTFNNTFDKIHAEENLKQKTVSFLYSKFNKKQNFKNSLKFKFSVCAASIMLAVVIIYSWIYFTPISYVDIDVNPSIEFSVNRFNKVIKANAYNEDGAEILQNVNVQNMIYEEAIDKLIYVMEDQGYFQNECSMTITIQTNLSDNETNMVENLKTKIDNLITARYNNVESIVFAVSSDVRNNANEHHMTPAKYIAISELQEVDSTATYSSCRNHSIDEINQLIKNYGGSHHQENENKSSEKNSCRKK